MNSYQAYQTWRAVKAHFGGEKYDFFKYGGKLRGGSPMDFETRKDKWMFEKLGREEDVIGYVVSAVCEKPEIWIGDALKDETRRQYLERQGRIAAMPYRFKDEIRVLRQNGLGVLIGVAGKHPQIVTEYLGKRISLETLTVISEVTKVWPPNVTTDPVEKPIALRVVKYRPFLHVEYDLLGHMLKDHFS